MEENVIGAVLADDEIIGPIVGSILIAMVDDST